MKSTTKTRTKTGTKAGIMTGTKTLRRSGGLVGLALLLPALAPAAARPQAAATNGKAVRGGATRGQAVPYEAAGPSELGPENALLAQRAGVWDVVETVWAAPDAAPTTNKLVAERRMIGQFLQETIRPVLGSKETLRIDYTSFHRGEGRWKYVSMDMRAPVGIMSAASFGTGEKGRIEVTFEPLTMPGTGQLLQMNQVFVLEDANHDRKDQRFVIADGKGTKTKHLYAYTRRP